MDEPNKGGDPWSMVLFLALAAADVVLLGLGVYTAVRQQDFTVLGLGLAAVIVQASLYASGGRGQVSGGSGTPDALQQQTRLLQSIADRMLISDQAKRIAYRQKDRDALRQAILDDIRQQDYGAAMALVNDMAGVYGYREEAEKYRQQILDAQAKTSHALIAAATTQIDQLLQRHDWDAARREVDRLTRMYPDYPEIAQLPARVQQAQEKYKLDLANEFREAYEREDTDRATRLLTEMDRYLNADEAKPYVDMARHVLNQKRENMGVQFKMAVQDRDWTRAVTVGEQIIREFPNSLFAAEVREMLDTLRERAGQRTAVAGG